MVNRLYGIFPIPYPDENCYSILCRYAVRRGRYSSSQICLELFGHQEPLSGYLFKPFRLRDIQRWFEPNTAAANVKYGEDHSCYPYYSPFLSISHAEVVRSSNIGVAFSPGQAKRINRECGFSKNHKQNLWYCPACVQLDLSQYGETCWRRLPQMPGAICCPIHGERFLESGVTIRDINYQLIPATYALFHVPEPVQTCSTIYAERYIRLARDIRWLLDEGFFISDSEWMTQSFFRLTGKPINGHLLHDVSRKLNHENRFEDYLASRIVRDTGKERIDLSVSQQIGSILSIEDVFGSLKKFYST